MAFSLYRRPGCKRRNIMSFIAWLRNRTSIWAREGRTRRRTRASCFRPQLLVEKLEDRITPSLLGTFELDGNVMTGVLGNSGSATTSHDWDQAFADNNSVPPPISGALTSAFVSDAVN